MAKVKGKSSTVNDKNMRNLIIVAAVVLVIGIVAFFAEKQKIKETSSVPPPDVAGVKVVHLTPDQGCKLDDAGSNYECNLLIRNISDQELEWFAEIEGLDGAELSNGGEGVVEQNNNATITLLVPTAFCDNNPQGRGTVAIKDSVKSTDQSLASFYCSEVPSEEETSE